MSEVCNERIPLHASFTPTRPLLTRIRLPSTCAGVPSSIAVSAATRATTRINPWITGVSRAVGQGTAMKMNTTGNAKYQSHLFPPAPQRSKSVNVMTTKAWIQASNRHSGLAISKRRTGNNMSNATTAIAKAEPLPRQHVAARAGDAGGLVEFLLRRQRSHHMDAPIDEDSPRAHVFLGLLGAHTSFATDSLKSGSASFRTCIAT